MKKERALLTELRTHITIPEYEFEDVTFFPMTKTISVAIFVMSDIYTILHSCKATIKEIAIDLNKQYERFMNTEHEQMELKSVVDIPFKCPYLSDSCPFVDTMTATLDKNCSECENNTNK